MNRNAFYNPYTSDDTDTDTDTDPRYDIIRAAGPNLNTSAEQLKYMQHLPGAEYSSDTNITSLSSLTYLNPPKTIATTLYSIKSADRDKSIYPSPYNFKIKLPKVYKNVSRFQLLQISFPYNIGDGLVTGYTLTSSISTFISINEYTSVCVKECLSIFTNSATKANSFSIMEQGRIASDGNQMLSKIEIPTGNFNNIQIAQQLNVESNNTPPFNIIDYDTFKNAFKITRDIKLLFNEPGDNYQSKILSKSYTTHSKDIIMNTYYTQNDIDKHPIITDTIAFNAYYYPILKELLIKEFGYYFINTEIEIDTLKYYVFDTFLGLDSEIYYNVCFNNVLILDEYRKNYTFQHKNINKYNWSYDTNLQKFNCTHDTLHTSLRADINNSLNKCISDELQYHLLNNTTYNALKANNNTNNTILNHLEITLSTIFTSYFLETYEYSNGLYSNRSFSDLHNDPLFTNMFDFTNIFGNQYGTFSGKKMTFRNFIDYHSTISSYYSMVQSTSNSISSIYGNIYDKHHTYISSKYSNVFSNDMIENRTYTNFKSIPVAFVNATLNISGASLYQSDSCVSTCYNYLNNEFNRYYSNLPVNTVINTLNYKLGLNDVSNINFNSMFTFLNVVSTSHFNFFLQINPEMSFNNIDVSMPENYNISNETTGQTKLMFGKILTGGLGSRELSQTCIQNPIIFTNTLGKLDKLTFKIYLDNESIVPMWLFHPYIQQRDEWTATFQIDEEIGFADRNAGWGATPTIPIPTNPDAFSYMALTKEKPK